MKIIENRKFGEKFDKILKRNTAHNRNKFGNIESSGKL